jgi:hypothetical protein
MADPSIKRVEPSLNSRLTDVHDALERIQAAAWLVDRVDTGELSFLTNPPHAFRCWDSFVSLSVGDLAQRLRHLAQREIADALKAGDVALQAASAQQAGVPGGLTDGGAPARAQGPRDGRH